MPISLSLPPRFLTWWSICAQFCVSWAILSAHHLIVLSMEEEFPRVKRFQIIWFKLFILLSFSFNIFAFHRDLLKATTQPEYGMVGTWGFVRSWCVSLIDWAVLLLTQYPWYDVLSLGPDETVQTWGLVLRTFWHPWSCSVKPTVTSPCSLGTPLASCWLSWGHVAQSLVTRLPNSS